MLGDTGLPRGVNAPPVQHPSPPPFLSELAGLDWRPALPVAPYRPRRTRRDKGSQEPLLAPELKARTGQAWGRVWLCQRGHDAWIARRHGTALLATDAAAMRTHSSGEV